MRNKYPGICYRCGRYCDVGEGHFEKVPFEIRKYGDPKYRVQHASCAILHRGTDLGKEGASEKREAVRDGKLFRHAAGTGKRAQKARQELKRRGLWF